MLVLDLHLGIIVHVNILNFGDWGKYFATSNQSSGVLVALDIKAKLDKKYGKYMYLKFKANEAVLVVLK